MLDGAYIRTTVRVFGNLRLLQYCLRWMYQYMEFQSHSNGEENPTLVTLQV
jgi:hypothetical protein